MGKKLAAIDIGTNSIHLVIAEADEQSGKFRIIGKEREPVRLGTGSSDMKYLQEDSISRGIEVLSRFRELADAAGAPLRAIATSAVREALNQNEFIRRAKEKAGIKIEVASGIEEARYIYLGVMQSLPVYNKHILLVDIGGGSTEFLIGFRSKVYYDNSIKIGAVRLSNRFFSSDKRNKQQVKDCRKYIKGILQPLLRDLRSYSWEIAVGCSGTILNTAGIINIKRGGSPSSRLNNFTFSYTELAELVDEAASADSVKALKKIQGLDPQRADIFTAGILILEQIFKGLSVDSMTCSEYALREGIVYDMMEKLYAADGSYDLDDIRIKSVLHTARNYNYESEHSHHVTSLSLSIFEQLKKVHKLGHNEKDMLHAAALLHEVGSFVSHSQHHRHSYYLIRNSELLGFTENEKEIIANIARYHRKSHPKQKHPDFAKLQDEDKRIVKMLAGILRIADGLDRTHSSAVQDINCTLENEKVVFRLIPKNSSSLELEIWGAEMKKQLFEDVSGLKAELTI